MHNQRISGELQGAVGLSAEEGVGWSCRESLHDGISTGAGS